MITVTGSLAFDHIMDFPGKFADHIMPDKIHQINLSFLVNTLKKQKGGTAGNIAYNLALLDSPVSILGTVGHDFSEYGKFLLDAGVDTAPIKIIQNEPTSSAFITTDQSDNQIAAFYPGAMNQVSSCDIKSLPEKPEFVVISPNPPEAMTNFALQCQVLKIPYLFDPGMMLPRLSNEQLITGIKGAAILIGNDYEIALLSNKLHVTSNKLLEQVRILITTLGEKGSVIKTKDEKIKIKIATPDVRRDRNDNGVVDPTGAGDAYRAGFLAGYIKGFNLKVCGQMGSVAACYAIEKYGTTNHNFSIEEFCERYKQNFGEELSLG